MSGTASKTRAFPDLNVKSMIQPGGAEALEVADLDPLAVLVGDLVGRVRPELEGAERHVERVDGEDPPAERLTESQQQLDGLDRLDRPHDARQHAEHTGLG